MRIGDGIRIQRPLCLHTASIHIRAGFCSAAWQCVRSRPACSSAMCVVCLPCGAHARLNPDRESGSSESGFSTRVESPIMPEWSLRKTSAAMVLKYLRLQLVTMNWWNSFIYSGQRITAEMETSPASCHSHDYLVGRFCQYWLSRYSEKLHLSNVAPAFCTWISVITQNGGRVKLCTKKVEDNWGNNSEVLVSYKYGHVFGYLSNCFNISFKFDYFWVVK